MLEAGDQQGGRLSMVLGKRRFGVCVCQWVVSGCEVGLGLRFGRGEIEFDFAGIHFKVARYSIVRGVVGWLIGFLGVSVGWVGSKKKTFFV